MKRSCGVLLHISSLPSAHGVGALGSAAYGFVDFLKKAGQTWWQTLPIGPAGDGNSPYMPVSTFAGNPLFIDLDLLAQDGLLDPSEAEGVDWGVDPAAVDYDALAAHRDGILYEAYRRGFARDAAAFAEFAGQHSSWLDDYALFLAAKAHFGGDPWLLWPDESLRLHEPDAVDRCRALLRDQVDFHRYVQFLFDRQWRALKDYAHRNGVRLIGDIPIYVSMDSADTWANPSLFRLDDARNPECVAGCPPDYFSETGQLWGNPLYDWDALKAAGYDWWIRRIGCALERFDVVRIDHFRGFESYYDIPFGEATAQRGTWKKGPGMDLFRALRARFGPLPIIAEDLGFLTDEVRALLRQTRFPGMKVLQFAFDSGKPSDYQPHRYGRNCVVYTGTHDNDTLTGFFASADPKTIEYAAAYFRLTAEEGYNWGFIRGAYESVANLAIVPMQDFLNLPSAARMNTPSTVGNNWKWRVRAEELTDALAEKIRRLAALYER